MNGWKNLHVGFDFLSFPGFATNQQIDRLVYDLYGLSEEEITVMEDRSQR